MMMTEEMALADGMVLVQVARAALARFVRERWCWSRMGRRCQRPFSSRARRLQTLAYEGRLRGRIGNVVEERLLIEGVIKMTIAAASRDPRFCL
ncbi:MAG: AMMECR1 domain-containing protein [Ardenticatenaceae bacterium]|nr:AMMECR1 domain-containing protein [Ardenticatenaceae bacterium]